MRVKRVQKTNKGDLVRVKLTPLIGVKMQRSEAIAVGLIPDPDAPEEKPEPKQRRKAQNKQRTVTGNKGVTDEE